MSDFDYSLDVMMDDEDYEDGYNNMPGGNRFGWDNQRPMPPGPYPPRRPPMGMGYMNAQYSEAFGDYRGGYGPDGGFGPPRPVPHPLMSFRGRGHGFGPIGPPPRRGPQMHRAALFLSKCDVAHNYIKALPKKLLDLIEPEYCGLCSVNLESFALAKNHYNSKNHYKAQKKFLFVHKQTKNQEMPLKSRNLYCELCDVQITSTAHADSHYAGKSHRAIVEHRKPPKNPFLLQPSMNNRVQQLIRREKKNLKPVSEAAEVVTKMNDAPAAAVPEKNVPPELVCEICKTTVTCSEQMTNHLNGKKHLTKEKQHILNMMKGKKEDDKIKEDNTDDDYVGEQGSQQETGPESGAVGENGGGAGNIGGGAGGADGGVDDGADGDAGDDWGAGGDDDWDAHNTA